MKNILGFVLLICFSSTSFGQQDTTKVPIVSYWEKGNQYNFKITKVEEKWKEGKMVKNDTSSYIVNFLVLDSTETEYTIKWSYETNLQEFELPDNIKRKLSDYRITEVIYKTSEVGVFLGIENWEEVSKMMNDIFSVMLDEVSKEDRSDEEKEKMKRVMEPLVEVYKSKQAIEQLVFKELQYFHFLFGIEFSVNEPIVYEDELPNFLGGDPFKGETKIYVDSVDFDNSFCVVNYEMKLDPVDTKNMLKSLFEKMKLEDAEMMETLEKAKFDIMDNNRFEFNFYDGVPINIEAKREVLIDIGKEKSKKVDKVIIELIE